MPATPKTYTSALYHFMSFLDGITYSPDNDTVNFSADRLASITADDVVRYFNFKAYGTTEPGVNDLPKLVRSSTILFHKKAISYFMPRQNMQWDDFAHRGNPTKSTAVNKVIAEIKKHEVRGTGVPTSARRAVEWLLLGLMIACSSQPPPCYIITARRSRCTSKWCGQRTSELRESHQLKFCLLQ